MFVEFHTSVCPCCAMGEITIMVNSMYKFRYVCNECDEVWEHSDTRRENTSVQHENFSELRLATAEEIKIANLWHLVKNPGWY
jgi:hypothetical protein